MNWKYTSGGIKDNPRGVPLLNRTLYKDRVELAYQLGSAAIVSQEHRNGHYMVHAVISLPDQQELRPVYGVLQTEIILKNTNLPVE